MRLRFGWVLIATLLAACGDEKAADEGGWEAKVVFTAPDKIGGLDIGDVDPGAPGPEVACVLRTGAVYVVGRVDGDWSARPVAKVAGEMLQCAIGDVDDRRPGNEIVAVGMQTGTEEDGGPGAVYVISPSEGPWRCEEAWIAPALVHGVCVADLDPDRPGNEIVCVGFDRAVTVVFRDGDGWGSQVAAALPGNGKSIVARPGMIVAGNPGVDAIIATSDGSISKLYRSGGKWHLESQKVSTAGQSRLGADEDGRFVSAADDGTLWLFAAEKPVRIHKEDQKLRGAVLADLDASSPGLEAATASYRKTITVLYPPEAGDAMWRSEVVYTDTARFHHLDAGDLIPDAPGLELAGCGYSKNLVIVRRK